MACQNLVMLAALVFTAFVLGAKVTVLAQSCKRNTPTCIQILVLGDINQENVCNIQSKYLPCLETVLTNVKCDNFSLLALKYTAIQDYNTINSQSACNLVVPNQFQFNACTQQQAVCGQHINNAFDNADIRIRCRALGDFETCMKSQTGNCSRTLVNDLSQEELSNFNYTSSCIDTTTTSTAPSTKAMMTTTQQTTQKPAPTTPASSTPTLPTIPSLSMPSSTKIAPSPTPVTPSPTSPQQTTQKPAPSTSAPTTPSLSMPSSTKIAQPPTPVTPSPTSRTSTSEGTTALSKPSSSLPNTKIIIGTNSGSTDSLCPYLLMIETMLVLCLQHIFVL